MFMCLSWAFGIKNLNYWHKSYVLNTEPKDLCSVIEYKLKATRNLLCIYKLVLGRLLNLLKTPVTIIAYTSILQYLCCQRFLLSYYSPCGISCYSVGLQFN